VEQKTEDNLGIITNTDLMEFATEEAALGWRREVQAAIYINRSRRGAAEQDAHIETPADAAAESGVRISIPYTTLRDHRIRRCEGCALIIQLELGPQRTDSDASGGGESGSIVLPPTDDICLEQLLTCGPLARGWDNDSQQRDIGTLHFASLQAAGIWAEFDGIVARAKNQAAETILPTASAVVDFGSLTSVKSGVHVFAAENARNTREVPSGSREQEVRKLFGLEHELEIWSKSPMSISPAVLILFKSLNATFTARYALPAYWSYLRRSSASGRAS
jgi:hypothetical protein